MDPELERRVRELARQEGISLNQAVLRLLRRGAGVDEPQISQAHTVGDSLDHLIGTWTDQEAGDFRAVVENFERIDESLWQ